MDMAMVMEETMMIKRNSLIFLTAFGLLLTGCSKSGLEITKDDILEVARDDANATKSECENVSIKGKRLKNQLRKKNQQLVKKKKKSLQLHLMKVNNRLLIQYWRILD